MVKISRDDHIALVASGLVRFTGEDHGRQGLHAQPVLGADEAGAAGAVAGQPEAGM